MPTSWRIPAQPGPENGPENGPETDRDPRAAIARARLNGHGARRPRRVIDQRRRTWVTTAILVLTVVVGFSFARWAGAGPSVGDTAGPHGPAGQAHPTHSVAAGR